MLYLIGYTANYSFVLIENFRFCQLLVWIGTENLSANQISEITKFPI